MSLFQSFFGCDTPSLLFRFIEDNAQEALTDCPEAYLLSLLVGLFVEPCSSFPLSQDKLDLRFSLLPGVHEVVESNGIILTPLVAQVYQLATRQQMVDTI